MKFQSIFISIQRRKVSEAQERGIHAASAQKSKVSRASSSVLPDQP
jgi:hypothetical protein